MKRLDNEQTESVWNASPIIFKKTGFVVKSSFPYTNLDCRDDWIKGSLNFPVISIFLINISKFWPKNPASRLLQIGCKLEKWQWYHNFSTWCCRKFFWRFFLFLVKLKNWSKFHVNITTGSGILTVSFYKGLTRN